MNTTYTSRLKPQFSNAGVQDVTADFSVAKQGLELLAKENENELKALKNIAQDQAQIEFNRGAAELVDKYGTDFKGLSQAMLGLEQDLYNRIKPTYPEMAEDLLRQYDSARLRSVEHARKTYISENNKKIRATSQTMLGGVEAAATSDYLIYLGEISKAPEERNPENINPFLQDLAQHNAILDRLDMDGNPIFTPEYKASKKGMKGVMLNATYDLINGMTLEQLQNWRNTTLQSEQFRKDSGFDTDDWEKINSKANSRIKELEKDEKHEIKVRAIQQTAGLINNSGDMLAINELKKSDVVPEELIDRTVEASNKLIENNWYDPKNESDPTGLLQLYSELGELVNQTDESPEATLNRIELTAKIMEKVGNNAKELNLDTEKYREYMDVMQKAVVDNEFRTDARPIVEFAQSVSERYSEFEDDLKALTGEELDKKISEEKVIGDYSLLKKRQAKRNGQIYVSQNMPYLVRYLLNGDKQSAADYLERMKYEQTKIENSYWLPTDTMDLLELKRQKGEKPLYYHNGTVLEYNGVSDNTALFKTLI